MRITITDTPITLKDALEAQNYRPITQRDAGRGITLLNDTRSYNTTTNTTESGADNGPIFVEGSDLRKFDGGVDTTSNYENAYKRGTETYVQQGRNVEDPEKYIEEAEAYPIFNGESFSFNCYGADRIHLVACPGKTVEIKVFIE